jgi:hypothetical protein
MGEIIQKTRCFVPREIIPPVCLHHHSMPDFYALKGAVRGDDVPRIFLDDIGGCRYMYLGISTQGEFIYFRVSYEEI